MTKNELVVVINTATICLWGKSKQSKVGAKKINDLLKIRVGGEVTLYCSSVATNPFTGDPLFNQDGDVRLGMRSVKIRVDLDSIKDWVMSMIDRATDGQVQLKTSENAQVYHLNVASVLPSSLERCIKCVEIEETFSENYYLVEIEDGKLKRKRDNNGRAFRTTVMHTFAVPSLGISEEKAVAMWHRDHATDEDLLSRAAKLSADKAEAKAALDAKLAAIAAARKAEKADE